MAFFNYSTMQMTAKIVYYGPGLGGKTTNLEYIHRHTTDDSRGEMVSLQTQTDRTLFFDLLPMEVGTVAGFRTRIQLYTVPGQVFYNTTRKLVLKGVDGVVFVADSQRPMLSPNVESLANLEENLATLSLSTRSIPLVLQYNKRDLEEICSVDELDAQLNEGGWPSFQASALYGQGVVETLQGITRLTLLSLKKQLETSSGVGPAGVGMPGGRPPAKPPIPAARPRTASVPVSARPGAAPAVPAVEPPGPAASGNGRPALDARPARPRIERARRLRIDLRIEDDRDRVMHEVRDHAWNVPSPADLAEILERLGIDLGPEE